MTPVGQLISALVLAYFVSRLTRRLPFAGGRSRQVLISHAISLAILAVAVFSVRGLGGAIAARSLWYLVLSQALWAAIDGVRVNLGRRQV